MSKHISTLLIHDLSVHFSILHRTLELMRLTVEQNLRRMKWKQPYLRRRNGRWRRKKTDFASGRDEYFKFKSDYYSDWKVCWGQYNLLSWHGYSSSEEWNKTNSTLTYGVSLR